MRKKSLLYIIAAWTPNKPMAEAVPIIYLNHHLPVQTYLFASLCSLRFGGV